MPDFTCLNHSYLRLTICIQLEHSENTIDLFIYYIQICEACTHAGHASQINLLWNAQLLKLPELSKSKYRLSSIIIHLYLLIRKEIGYCEIWYFMNLHGEQCLFKHRYISIINYKRLCWIDKCIVLCCFGSSLISLVLLILVKLCKYNNFCVFTNIIFFWRN